MKHTYSLNNKSEGFTLIEVLVASVILFSAIATVSMIYRGAYISSQKADAHVNIAGIVPIVLDKIRENIREKGNAESVVLKGSDIAFGVNYHWLANQTAFKGPPEYFDPDSGKIIQSDNKYKLWKIDVELSYGVASKQYQFKELSWNDK